MSELVDLYPTVCDLMQTPIPEAAQGASLLPVLDDPTFETKPDALSLHNGHSLRSKRWHYIRYKDGTEELYDMEADPDETTNLVGRSQQKVLRQMRARLESRLDHLIERKSQR